MVGVYGYTYIARSKDVLEIYSKGKFVKKHEKQNINKFLAFDLNTVLAVNHRSKAVDTSLEEETSILTVFMNGYILGETDLNEDSKKTKKEGGGIGMSKEIKLDLFARSYPKVKTGDHEFLMWNSWGFIVYMILLPYPDAEVDL